MTLVPILLVALLLRIGAALHFPNVNVPDETFQTREPAHLLAYGYGIVTWEFLEGVRSWVFPAFLAGVMRSTDWIQTGSRGYLLGIVVILSIISLTSVWFSFMWGLRTIGLAAAVVASVASATWFELVYFGPKAMNDVVAAHVLLPGLYLGAFSGSIRERKRLFLSGLFCGLACALRPPLVPVVALTAAGFSLQNWRVRLPLMISGILVPIAFFGVVDAVTWSYPFESFVRFFSANVVQGKMYGFGTRPWYWFLPILGLRLGPLILLALVGVRRSPFLGSVAFLILLTFSLVPHKEFRFIYPMIPISVTLAGLGMAELISVIHLRWAWPRSQARAYAAAAVIFIFTSVILAENFPGWSRYSGSLLAFQKIGADATICGIGLRLGLDDQAGWYLSGGYTYLHRNVPIYPIPSELDLRRLMPSFNAIVASVPVNSNDFKRADCWRGTCLYRRLGSCTPSPRDGINEFLKRHYRVSGFMSGIP